MTRLTLTYAGLLYWDRTLALATGEVVPAGVDLRYQVIDWPGEIWKRQIGKGEFDLSEMSASLFIAMLSRGDSRFVGLPIFPSRRFRHGDVYIHRRSGIRDPQDLRGKRVGILEYGMTAGLWVRAFLEHDYGVRPADLEWYTGGLRGEAPVELMKLGLPKDVVVESIPQGSTLEGMLAAGELDALVSVQAPASYRRAGGGIGRLFDNYRSLEAGYLRRTGIFPIMHLVILRREVYESKRWVIGSICDAFEAAKRFGAIRLRQTFSLAVSLPWLPHEIEETDLVFGEGDIFPYGFQHNERTLEAMLGYAYEQGVAIKRLKLEEMFPPEALSWIGAGG